MTTAPKSYYKISEVSQMLGVPASTLRFWEDTFEQLDPLRTPGGTRKYRPEDVEMCRLIKHLLRDKGYSLEYAKTKLKEYAITKEINYDESAFPCRSSDDALRLLSELEIKCEADPYAVARIEAVERWIKNVFIVRHKNIRGKEYYTKAVKESKTDSVE